MYTFGTLAIVALLGIIGGFYALTCWASVVAIGPDQVTEVAQRALDGEGNMLLDTTDDKLGRLGRDIVNVLLLTSLFACVLSFHNVSPAISSRSRARVCCPVASPVCTTGTGHRRSRRSCRRSPPR